MSTADAGAVPAVIKVDILWLWDSLKTVQNVSLYLSPYAVNKHRIIRWPAVITVPISCLQNNVGLIARGGSLY